MDTYRESRLKFAISRSYSIVNMTKRRRPATAAKDPNALVPHASVLALDPQVLHDQAEASVRALLQEGESANTVRSYASALRYWGGVVPVTLQSRPRPARRSPCGAAISGRSCRAHRSGGRQPCRRQHDARPAADDRCDAGGGRVQGRARRTRPQHRAAPTLGALQGAPAARRPQSHA